MSFGANNANVAFNFSKAYVLVVDENPLFLDLTSGVLAGFGFKRIHRITQLSRAIEHVRTRPVDLMLIDPYPYGSEAYQFIRAIRTNEYNTNSTVPILIVTGHTRMRLVSETKQCGADFVVAKPFSMGSLLDRILFVAKQETRRTALLEPHAPDGRVFGATPW